MELEVNGERLSRVFGGVGNLLSASVTLLICSTSYAVPIDLIVRFYEPQNTRAAAAMSALKSGMRSQADVQVLNNEEGLIRLRFSGIEEARKAREGLIRSARVAQVAPNLLYQPAVSYRIKEVKQKSQTMFLSLPFADSAMGKPVGTVPTKPMPEVLLPPTVVGTGTDPLEEKDWAMKAIRMNEVAREVAGTEITTAVIDTGVDYNHEDLIGAMWRKSDNPHEVGFDFAHNHARPFDQVHFDVEGCMKDFVCRLGLDTSKYLVNPGHGTHCAGHVAAVYNNGLGIRGVGAGAKVMGLKFFYDVGEVNAGQGDDAAAIQSIDYAIKHGAKVISASWGGRVNREEAEKSELKQALVRAQKAGVLVVIAAGNDGVDQESVDDPVYPAAYNLDNLIVVAATDKDDKLAEFSCYGAKSVHIAAPGVKILSTTSGNSYSDVVARFKDSDGNEHQMDWDGTSMATPIVAGAAALVWSKHPTETYSEIRDRILKSARRVPALEGKVLTGGVLDVAAALR